MITLYYVIKRPGVDEFLESLIEHYNICIYTSSEDEVFMTFGALSYTI